MTCCAPDLFNFADNLLILAREIIYWNLRRILEHLCDGCANIGRYWHGWGHLDCVWSRHSFNFLRGYQLAFNVHIFRFDDRLLSGILALPWALSSTHSQRSLSRRRRDHIKPCLRLVAGPSLRHSINSTNIQLGIFLWRQHVESSWLDILLIDQFRPAPFVFLFYGLSVIGVVILSDIWKPWRLGCSVEQDRYITWSLMGWCHASDPARIPIRDNSSLGHHGWWLIWIQIEKFWVLSYLTLDLTWLAFS